MYSCSDEEPLPTAANCYRMGETKTRFWGGYFSPLVIERDGSVTIADTAIEFEFDPTTEVLSFDWQDIKTTKAKGKVGFKGDIISKTFSGSVNPRPQDGPVGYAGLVN